MNVILLSSKNQIEITTQNFQQGDANLVMLLLSQMPVKGEVCRRFRFPMPEKI